MNKNRMLAVALTAMVCTGLGVASVPEWTDSQFPNEGQKTRNTIHHRYSQRQNTKPSMEIRI